MNLDTKKRLILIYVCTLLSCLVPRYIPTLKVHIGINISYYTIVTLFSWLIFCRRIRIKHCVESYLFVIWLLFVLLSVWRAEKIGVWAYYLTWTTTAILFQQLLYIEPEKEMFQTIARALADGLFLHVMMGMYEVTRHTYIFENIVPGVDLSRRLYGHVAIGMFHNLNDYATFVVTILPFTLYMLSNSSGILKKGYYGITSLCSVYLLFKSESRGAFLALAIIIIVMVIILCWQSVLYGLAALFCGFSCFVAIEFVPKARIVFDQFIHSMTIDINSGSDFARINLIKNGLYFLELTHWLGVGAGNLYLWLGEKSIYQIGDLKFMHNWYFEILVTFGIFFFILYMYYHIRVLYNIVQLSRRKHSDAFALNEFIILSFVAFSIVSVSSSSNIYSEWVWMYLVFIGTYSMFITDAFNDSDSASLFIRR